jgi:RimJ/RimL family protein N-acetyltransferase
MLQYVKEDTNLQRLEIGVLKNNHKAKSLFTKFGFSYLNQSHRQGDDMVLIIER